MDLKRGLPGRLGFGAARARSTRGTARDLFGLGAFRPPGATLVAFAFVMPSFIMVVALAWLYLRFGGLPWMQGAFYRIGAGVIAIIARSAYKLTRTSLGRDYLLWALFGFSAVVTAWTESELCGYSFSRVLSPWRSERAARLQFRPY